MFAMTSTDLVNKDSRETHKNVISIQDLEPSRTPPEQNLNTLLKTVLKRTRPFPASEAIWRFPKIGVPLNHPFLMGFSLINQPFWGTPIYGTPTLYNDITKGNPPVTSAPCGKSDGQKWRFVSLGTSSN